MSKQKQKNKFCTQCSPGQYSGMGQSQCSYCLGGQYQDEAGQTQCKQCNLVVANSFSEKVGATDSGECQCMKGFDREDCSVKLVPLGDSVEFAILFGIDNTGDGYDKENNTIYTFNPKFDMKTKLAQSFLLEVCQRANHSTYSYNTSRNLGLGWWPVFEDYI